MKIREIINKINNIEQEIDMLPKGSIGKKEIKEKIYYYQRYIENGIRIEKYIDNGTLNEIEEKINKRKELETELKELKKEFSIILNSNNINFNSNILIGPSLINYVSVIKDYKKRFLFDNLNNYIYNNEYGKVCILYGLRRTGKTTLIRQLIFDMDVNDFKKTAFIQITNLDTLKTLNKDLKKLSILGYKYVFIDEITLIDDFIESASLFSDIYASSGMKIVLSGNDSLGFMFTKNEQLYDRCILIHTTFIPYREFEYVLGISGIDEYIKYGGTMSLSGVNYHENTLFNDLISTKEYIDTSIAKNIQHSLKYYDNGNHFRHLKELYEKNELTNVINRVVENINHRFTKEILIKNFSSSDLALSTRNLRRDQITILDEVDSNTINEYIKNMLEILNKNEQIVSIEELHAQEIEEYLYLLDLIDYIDERSFPSINRIDKNIIITQPGIRYAQACALIEALLLDEVFNNLPITDKNMIINRILNEIKGRMLEDIVLFETKMSLKNKEVFKLKFAIGEFDMVVFDPINISCEIYEIKYSDQIIDNQYRHLIDNEKIKLTELKFGKIINRFVIYRGISTLYKDINYINVIEYLKKL